MEMASSQDWYRGECSGMISIGSHRLHLSTSGPERKPGEPIVVLMQGLGASLVEWNIVRRRVSTFARWLQYDRSGLGGSEGIPDYPKAISAASVALELDTLLRVAGIEPPFVIVAHSWGGLTSREFLHIRPNDIVGMIFVDANQENHFYHRKEPLPEVGTYIAPYVEAVEDSFDYVHDVLEADQILTNEEWTAVLEERAGPLHTATSIAEFRGWKDDGNVLAAKNQFQTQPLGNRPVSVLRADSKLEQQRMYDLGVAKGNGTEEERASYRELIEHWEEQDIPVQKEILKISTFGRFRTIPKSLHCIQMVMPEEVVEEVKWVLAHITE